MAEKLTILCVDDDADALFISRMSLTLDKTLTVISATSGKEGLALLADPAQPVDCILLDVEMPEMSGLEMLSALRNLPGHAETPVIFVTAGVREMETKNYLTLGALGLIAKPYDPLTLAPEVRRIITRA